MNIFITYLHHTSAAMRQIIRLMLVIVMITGLGACGHDMLDQEPPQTEDTVDIYLTLTVDIAESYGLNPLTRTDNYFFEQPLRQNEKLNELRVFIVKEDGKIEGHRKVNFNSDGFITGSQAGVRSLTFLTTPGEKKIYLIGNESSLPDDAITLLRSLREEVDTFPVKDLNDIILSREEDVVFYSAEQDIPMAETFNITISATPSDMDSPLYVYKTLFVTRIATKYTILTPHDYESLSIRLTDIAKSQYFMPHGVKYSPAKDDPAQVINGVAGRAITEFEVPENTERATFEIELTGKTKIEDQSGEVRYKYDSFYLMETAGNNFKINALINAGPYEVDGVTYNGGWFAEAKTLENLPSLPRNTHVVINLSALAELNCEVALVPYRVCTLDPVFGLGGEEDDEEEETPENPETSDNP